MKGRRYVFIDDAKMFTTFTENMMESILKDTDKQHRNEVISHYSEVFEWLNQFYEDIVDELIYYYNEDNDIVRKVEESWLSFI